MRDAYPSQRAVGAALFLLARQYFPHWDGWPTEAEIVLLSGVSRSDVYGAREDLLDRLYDFLFDPYDTENEGPDPFLTSVTGVRTAICRFADEHPEAMAIRLVGGRREYTDAFCGFLVGLREKGRAGEGLSIDDLAFAADMPLEALEDWLKSQPDSR